jgi:hypothetical protein
MKLSEGKGEDNEEVEVVGLNLLPILAQFMKSQLFQTKLETFYFEYIDIFSHIVEGKSEDTEFSHEHKNAFDSFQSLLDALFELFAAKEDVAMADVFKCCKDSVDGRFVPLFQEDEHKWIVEALLSYLDFDAFLQHMRCAAQRRQQWINKK